MDAYRRKQLLYIGLMMMLSLLWGQAVFAQEEPTAVDTGAPVATAVPFAESPPGTIEISLEQLGRSNITLRGPIDAEDIAFSLPYRWQLMAGGYLQLYYDLLFDAGGQTASTEAARTFLLEIYLDDDLVAALNLQQGRDQAVQVPLPATAVNDPDHSDHTLRFILTTGRDCDTEGRTSLHLHNLSFLHLAYNETPAALDLATFPRPLVQELLTPETISLVIPDSYSTSDLQTVASLSAMLGERTDNGVGLSVLTASEATPERLAGTHTVLIGTPQSNSLIADWYSQGLLPTQLDASGAITAPNQTIFADDGVVQLAQTEAGEPVVLLVTGATEPAVLRAAQALSARQTDPLFGFAGPLAVIEAVNEGETAVTASPQIYTLADLGFRDTTLYGVGTQSKTVSFFVPSNWRLTEDPLLLLNYIPSAVLQPAGSALTVYLNNQPVASTILDGSVAGERELLVQLPADEILLGDTNRLRLEVTMDMDQPCSEPDLGLAWTRLKDNGRLQLAYAEASATDAPLLIQDPLTPLISRFDLGNIWFSLPESPTAVELNGLAGVASVLGDISRGYHFVPQVAIGELDTSALDDAHVVALGEPTRSSTIGLVNEELPQPFAEGSNEMRQQMGSVIFRLPENFSLGIIQAIHAPWNPQRAVTVVTGTNAEGVGWSVGAIVNNDLAANLDGNVSFVRQDKVEAVDLSVGQAEAISLSLVPEVVAKVTQAALPESAAESAAGETAEVVALVEPTAVPQTFPEPGPLPAEYTPEASNFQAKSGLVFLLIGGGVAVALLGLVISARRARAT